MSEWYYTVDRKQMGPVSSSELKKLAEAGLLQPTDLIWREGMANWVKAETTKGLFPAKIDDNLDRERQSSTAIGDSPQRKRRIAADEVDDEAPRRGRRAADEENEERPRRRRRSVEDDHYYDDDTDDDREPDDEYQPRPRKRRRRAEKQGAQTVKIMLAVVGGVIGLGVVVGAVVFIINLASGPPGPRNFNLAQGHAVSWRVYFEEKRRVEIRVTSTGQSDVDLYVFDAGGRQVAFDDHTSKDCFVAFVPASSQRYKVEVRNMIRIDEPFRNGRNSGTVTFIQQPTDQVANNNPPPNNPPPPPPGQPPRPVFNGPAIPINVNAEAQGQIEMTDPFDPRFRGNRCKLYTCTFEAGRTYLITMDSNDLDAFLCVEDPQGKMAGLDDDGGQGLNSRLVFRANLAGTYRIYASSLGGDPGSYTLRVQQR